ncbi:Hypothetical predicted protein [Paramuricea clavata]|uniref:Uncharacterized protein n=1 Tax=Paramuricea clavata TaxID=317549 RepID=A0A7D9KXG7_PARCT|nr:Hypothetical predicted protein [Paramuricea clavata]
MSKKTLLAMLIKCGEGECGDTVVKKPNAAIPHSFINIIHNLQVSANITLEDAVKQVRNNLVPVDYTPYPFKKDTEKYFLDMLRSLVATCIYRDKIKLEGTKAGPPHLDPLLDPLLDLSEYKINSK